MAQNIVGGKVIWGVELDMSQFNKGMASVKEQMNNLGGNLEKSNSGFKQQGSVLDGVGKKLAALAAGYLSFRAVSGIIQGSIDKFNAYEESVTKLTTVILNQSGATQDNVRALIDQAQALSNVTTFSAEQIITAQTVMGTFDGMTSVLVQKAIPAFLNYTALQYGNIESTEQAKQAAEGFTKAVVGQRDVLTKQGFVFTEAQKAIFDTGTVTERLDIVIQAMSYAGDAAADMAGTLQGRMKVLGNQFDNSRLAIGGVAQLVKVELLNAFITGSSGGQAWGDNMLTISKQVGEAFLTMGNAVIQIMNGLVTAAMTVGAAIGNLGTDVKGTLELSATNKLRDENRKTFEEQKAQIEGLEIAEEQKAATIKRLRDEQVKQDQILLSQGAGAAGQSTALQAALDEVNKGADRAADFNNLIGEAKDRVGGLTDITDLMAISAKEAGSSLRDMGQEGAASGEDMKKASEKMSKAQEKVIDFRQKEVESSNKVREALEKQKTKLAELKIEYEKAVASIKRSLEDLDRNFDKSDKSARESFLGSLASAAERARQTIADREAEIQTEQNQATPDQAKIASLQALNEKEKAILESNAKLIAEADKIEAEKKTAVGVQNLINRFNQEREEARKNFEREKSELQSQLAEKEEEYKKSQANIKADTIKSIGDIRSAYIKMFDDLQRELKKLGDSFLQLMKLGAISAPGPSKQAEAAFAALTKNIPKRALGGPVMPHRPYMVGERGPEIIVPKSAGTVIPNGAGATINLNISEKADWRYGLQLIKRELGIDSISAQHGINN